MLDIRETSEKSGDPWDVCIVRVSFASTALFSEYRTRMIYRLSDTFEHLDSKTPHSLASYLFAVWLMLSRLR